jgi:hypothetical protein
MVPNRDVLRVRSVQPAGGRRGIEHHGEVLGLPGVGDVDQPVGVQLRNPVAEGGQVGDAVPVAAV